MVLTVIVWMGAAEGIYRKRIWDEGADTKKFKPMVEGQAEGILWAEVWLTKPKAVRVYADTEDVCMQITELSRKAQDIF